MLELLKELEEKNIKILLKDNNLEVSFDGDIEEDLLVRLKTNKDKLIVFLKKYSHIKNDIKNVEISKDYPISHAQKRLWIQSQNIENSKAYHLHNQIVLNGDYKIEYLDNAIWELIKRHEILRTIFKVNNELEVRQLVLEETDAHYKTHIQHIDLRLDNYQVEKIEEYIEEDNKIPFNLEKGPLFRMCFFQLSDQQFILYYNMHHIITDGWSINILERDFFLLHHAIKLGIKPQLPQLKIQYKDYAIWQKKSIEQGHYLAHKDFWVKELSGELPKLELPSFKNRPKVMSYNGRMLQTFLSPELTKQLQSYSLHCGGSLFMGIVASLKIVLSKYANQEDIIIGFPVAGREDSDLENQIGFYVNTLVLRNKIDIRDSFFTFFEKVKNNVLEVLSHQIYPFDLLVEDLKIRRDISRHPIFDVSITFNNTHEDCKEGAIVDDSTIDDLGITTCLNDLEFHFQEYGDSLYFIVNFNNDVYDFDTVKRIIMQFKAVLPELLNQPLKELNQITWFSENERKQLLEEFNNTKTDSVTNKSVVYLFEEQVFNSPDSLALTYNEMKLTYKELNEQSNQLARFLVDNYECMPGDLIGIKLDYNEYLIIAILAVLKSGAAFIPIDIWYPKDRIDYIENETNCKVIIDEEVILMYKIYKDKYNNDNLVLGLKDKDLAYVMYTSGSSGSPKGVMIEHQNLSNYLQWSVEFYFENEHEGNFGLFTSLSFDLTLTSIFLPLIRGKKINVYDKKEDVLSILTNYFSRSNDLDIIKLTPAHLELVKRMDLGSTAVKKIIVGGEALLKSQVESILKLNNNLKIYNEYGPTECTIGCIAKQVNEDVHITIGKPIWNTQVYILNDNLQLVPIGVQGNIYIAGLCVARGYWNRTELTEERFIENPFKRDKSIYATGDLGRWLPDGNIEYFGRSDEQVKIRGFRIEVGEIENVILQFSQLINQVVVDVRNREEDMTLVAYFTAMTDIDIFKLRQFLLDRLPHYMIPSSYFRLDYFSLTANNKIDRKALPKFLESNDKDIYVAPRNIIEERLVEIWEKILKQENIGVKDDFFERGGHSLKAIEVIMMIQKEFNLSIDLYLFFENPTIEFLYSYIENVNYNIDKMNNEDDCLIF